MLEVTFSTQLRCKITCEPYVLHLRSPFGTSHSLTTTRTNALFRIAVLDGSVTGFGEVGLPPKKPSCYLADYDDVRAFFDAYGKRIEAAVRMGQDCLAEHFRYDPFAGLPVDVQRALNTPAAATDATALAPLFRALFSLLDAPTPEPYARAARSGLEIAFLDAWAKLRHEPLHDMLAVPLSADPKRFFYTVGLNDNLDQLLDTARFGLRYTPFLKVKLDADLDKAQRILARLYELCAPLADWQLSVDANAAWTPAIARRFLELLRSAPYRNNVCMLEQPFPVQLHTQPAAELAEWVALKQQFGALGVPLYADESCSTASDVPTLTAYVHGVNVKLEKTGGVRGALQCIAEARRHSLQVWLGTMVGSSLNCTVPVHLLPLADIGGDLDGALLVDEHSQRFVGSFTPRGDGLVRLREDAFVPPEYGIGVRVKQQE